MKKYSIGKFAKYSGVTPDFIKYYEKHHIMIPSVEPNGYRSYEMPDFATLNECIKYRDMGFSASDIESLLKDNDYESTLSILNSNIPLLKKQLFHLQEIIKYTEELSRELPKYKEKNPWTLQDGDEMYYLPISENFEYIRDKCISDLLAVWQKYHPAVLSAARVDIRSITTEEKAGSEMDGIQWGVLISKKSQQMLELPINDKVEAIPVKKYLTVFDRRLVPPRSDNNYPQKLKRTMFYHTENVLQKYPFHVIGPSFFIVRSKITENGARYTYQKVMTPIE